VLFSGKKCPSVGKTPGSGRSAGLSVGATLRGPSGRPAGEGVEEILTLKEVEERARQAAESAAD